MTDVRWTIPALTLFAAVALSGCDQPEGYYDIFKTADPEDEAPEEYQLDDEPEPLPPAPWDEEQAADEADEELDRTEQTRPTEPRSDGPADAEEPIAPREPGPLGGETLGQGTEPLGDAAEVDTQTGPAAEREGGAEQPADPADYAVEETVGIRFVPAGNRLLVERDTLPGGQRYMLEVTNEDEQQHALELLGPQGVVVPETALEPGQTLQIGVRLEPGEYRVLCATDAHADEGERATLRVTE